MCVRRWESAGPLPPEGQSKCNTFINLLTHKEACLSVLVTLPAGRSAAGSVWGVQGVAGLKRRGHPNTKGACDYLKKEKDLASTHEPEILKWEKGKTLDLAWTWKELLRLQALEAWKLPRKNCS